MMRMSAITELLEKHGALGYQMALIARIKIMQASKPLDNRSLSRRDESASRELGNQVRSIVNPFCDGRRFKEN